MRRRLIDQINGFVRQAAIADVAVGETVGGLNGLIGDVDAVVQLVALLQAAQNFEAQLQIRLPDHHLLEAAVEGRILFHREPVILWRGGTDAAQIATGEGWFQQAAGIGAAAITADNGVQLIDEQHHPGIGTTHLLEHRAQAFLELTTELGTGDQSPEIQRHQPQTLQRLRHFTRHDPLRQQLRNRCFANTGFTDEHRIVLAPAREHLDQVANFRITTDHRIQAACFRLFGEIPSIRLQGRGGFRQGGLRSRRLGGDRSDRLWPAHCTGGGGNARHPFTTGRFFLHLGLRPRHRPLLGWNGHARNPVIHTRLDQLLQGIGRQTKAGEQISTDARIGTNGHQHLRQIDDVTIPAPTDGISRIEQLFQVITDEELIASPRGLIGQHILQAVQERIDGEGQTLHQAAAGGIGEQHLDQMLHVQLLMAPATGNVLTTQQQIPGRVAEAIRLMGEAAVQRWR